MEISTVTMQVVSAAAVFNGAAFFLALRSRAAWMRKVDTARDSYRGIVGDLAGQVGNLEAHLDLKDASIARLVAQRDKANSELVYAERHLAAWNDANPTRNYGSLGQMIAAAYLQNHKGHFAKVVPDHG